MSGKPSFFAELKRRNVYKVAVAYAVVGWALAQGIAQVFPVFDIPNWAVRLIVLAIVIGFPIALVIAWAFELTPEGIKHTEDVDLPARRVLKNRTWIYVTVIGAALSIGLFFIGEQLRIAASVPGLVDYGQLNLHTKWDSLRGDPRFEKIIASLAPKE